MAKALFHICSPEEIERLRREIGRKQPATQKEAASSKVSEQNSKDSDSGNESNDSLGSPEKENLPDLANDKTLMNGDVHTEEIAAK